MLNDSCENDFPLLVHFRVNQTCLYIKDFAQTRFETETQGTVAPRYNEPRYNEDPVITNNIWKPGRITVKYVETNPVITNPTITKSLYTMMAKPMKTLELHYPMIQFSSFCFLKEKLATRIFHLATKKFGLRFVAKEKF